MEERWPIESEENERSWFTWGLNRVIGVLCGTL
jgi:hypothetical protein